MGATLHPALIEAVTLPPRPGDRWIVDETCVKVKGVWRYGYRAVDHHGQVVDVYVSKRRNTWVLPGTMHRILGPHVSHPRCVAQKTLKRVLIPAELLWTIALAVLPFSPRVALIPFIAGIAVALPSRIGLTSSTT